MNTAFDLLEAEALKLTAPERALLAEHLLASLDEADEIEQAWAGEVAQRIAALEAGEVVAVPFELAMEQIYAALR